MGEFTLEERYMLRCIELAKKGSSKVSPNPMVGAVLVYHDNIIGEGYHKNYGNHHAEKECLLSVKEQDKQHIKDATLYVNLEPCCHYGNTPPCTDLILTENIKKVVIGTKDPSKKISGKGIDLLRQNGVAIKVGVLEGECKALNAFFLHSHTNAKPYTILKWAESDDGYISAGLDKERVVFSNPLVNIYTHKLRSRIDAIMVGKNTFLYDRPQLNDRYWSLVKPIIIIADRHLETLECINRYYNKNDNIWVVNGLKEGLLKEADKTIRLIQLDYKQDNYCSKLLSTLYNLGVSSLLVEGGTQLLNTFFNSAGSFQEFWTIRARHITLGQGIARPNIAKLNLQSWSKTEKLFLDNTLHIYQKPHN